MMRAALRADASLAIGSGHVMRMIALAQALRARGVSPVFISRKGQGDFLFAVERAGFPWIDPGTNTLADLTREGALDLLVVDHYEIDRGWETEARRHAACIVAIDDLGREHDCDVLVDQNFGALRERYEERIPTHARLLLGLPYAMLRESFARFVAHPPIHDGVIRRILVSFGGVDAGNQTSLAIEAAAASECAAHVDVVLSSQSPHAKAVEAACSTYGYAYHTQPESFESLMEAADLAIGAMGATAWERCLLGIPAIAISIAENQRAAASACNDAGIVRYLGESGSVSAAAIERALRDLANDPGTMRSMSVRARNASGADDGTFSTSRTADAVLEAAACKR